MLKQHNICMCITEAKNVVQLQYIIKLKHLTTEFARPLSQHVILYYSSLLHRITKIDNSMNSVQ